VVLRNRLQNAVLKIVHTIPCGDPGQNVTSHADLVSFLAHEHAITVLLAATVSEMNTNKLNAMPPTKASPCGLTGLNVLSRAVAVTCLDSVIIFVPMKLTNRRSLVTKTQEHGPPGLNGQHVLLLAAAAKRIETEYTLVLANGKTRQ